MQLPGDEKWIREKLGLWQIRCRLFSACWEPLWRQSTLPLLPGQEQDLPFRATAKMVGVNE